MTYRRLIQQIVGLGLLLLTACMSGSPKLTIPLATVQAYAAKGFPKQWSWQQLSTFSLEAPEVHGVDGNRLLLRLPGYVSVPILGKLPGAVSISGKVQYTESDHSFYLDDVRVEEMSFAGLPEQWTGPVREFANQTIPGYLRKVPLYQLKADSLPQNMAGMVLQDVYVEGENLQIQFKTPPSGAAQGTEQTGKPSEMKP